MVYYLAAIFIVLIVVCLVALALSIGTLTLDNADNKIGCWISGLGCNALLGFGSIGLLVHLVAMGLQ